MYFRHHVMRTGALKSESNLGFFVGFLHYRRCGSCGLKQHYEIVNSGNVTCTSVILGISKIEGEISIHLCVCLNCDLHLEITHAKQ